MKKIFSIIALLIAMFSFSFVEFNSTSIVNNSVEAKEASQVRALHILVPTEEQALQIRKEILTGQNQQEIFQNFVNAAKKYSKCPSGKDGGVLGWFTRGEMVPEFEQAAFNLPNGEVSEPVKTQFGWHLIYVISKK